MIPARAKSIFQVTPISNCVAPISRLCIHTPMKRFALKFIFLRIPLAMLVGAGLLLAACGRKEPKLPASLQVAREAATEQNWTTAVDHLIDAVNLFPNSLTAKANLAMAQWQAGNLNDAIATFNQIVSRDDVPPVIWKYYAQLQLEAGNPQATRELLDNIDPPTPETLTLRAMADIKMQAYERAKFILENAVEIDPSYAPAWYHLARIHREHIPNMIEAQIAFRNFTSYAPENKRAHESEASFLGQALPDPVPAGEETSQTVDPRPQTAIIQEHLQQARERIEQGETDAALIILQKTVEQYPNYPDAVWALAQFYDQELDLSNRADALYNTFLQLFPNDPRISQIPRRTRQQQVPQRPLEDQPVRQALLFQQGIEHYNRQQWDAAITAFRRVLTIAPQDAGASFNLGLAYHKTGDLDAAAAAFQQTLEHAPDMVKALYMLGLTERDRNNTPEALHLFNRVIRMQPDFTKAHQVLGRIYLREGRPDMTAIHFERIIEIAPQTDEAKRAREWLERQQNPR